MKPRPLYELFHTSPGDISLDLLYGFLPLRLGFCIKVLCLEILQFEDIAVRHSVVMLKVGHEEHVAKTVVQLYFGGSEVIGICAEVGGKEALYVALALDGAAHGRILLYASAMNCRDSCQ